MNQAPQEILSIWKKFDLFPMETLTKAWFLKRFPSQGQRTVQQMIEHRAQFGASGNCFDLAIWLISEFKKAGIHSYGVGEHLGTSDAHVGVVALDSNGSRFLCDLGDLWIQPINLDAPHQQYYFGFFTGAKVKLTHQGSSLSIEYHRTNEKVSHQNYDLTPVSDSDLFDAGQVSQRHLSLPLVEMRLQENQETIHWEFDNFQSFFSRLKGLEEQSSCENITDWASRISLYTGMKVPYTLECLESFLELAQKE